MNVTPLQRVPAPYDTQLLKPNLVRHIGVVVARLAAVAVVSSASTRVRAGLAELGERSVHLVQYERQMA